MRILYGLAGEGFGHSSRAKTIIPYLEKKGHRVTIITYGQALESLDKSKFRIFPIKGPHIIFKNNILNKSKTIKVSIRNLLSNLKNSKEIYKLMKQNFDLCISDMELTVSLLSSIYSIPLISIDNQHRLTNLEVNTPIPKKYKKEFLIAKGIIKAFAIKPDFYIITSFVKAKIKKKYKKNTFVVPPIIRPEVLRLKDKTEDKDFILVYLTKKNPRVLETLKRINEKFKIYGHEKNKKEKNLEFKKTGDHFIFDLAKCKAVIASAGFTLISEAIYLKKPYFAIPLQGQFEQTINAISLKKHRIGDYSESPKKEDIEEFISKLKIYRERLKKYPINEKEIFRAIDKVLGIIENSKA